MIQFEAQTQVADERQKQLEEMVKQNRHYALEGQVADYIPELANTNTEALGISVLTVDGHYWTAGDCQESFTLQSISKVITLIMAIMDHGFEYVFSKVGMEPTGDPFNSAMKLELMRPSKPLNPMINAGAIVVTSLIQGNSPRERTMRILDFVREMAHNSNIEINRTVYESEKSTGDRNRALAYLMKDNGALVGDVEEHLDVYFQQCSIEVTCSDIARMGALLANRGRDLATQKQVIPEEVAKAVKTFMVTCGMYNASGEFALRTGVPAKSGVSGGIMVSVPGIMGIGVIGPALDEKGNSCAGVKLLEQCSREWDLSIF